MKYKVYGIVSICLTFVVIASSLWFTRSEKKERYHQHLMAEPKAACSHSDDLFCTHLPLLQINTNGVTIPGDPIYDANGKRIGYTTTESGESELLCNLSVTDNHAQNNHINDTASVESSARIRIRGNSSRKFDKKGYSITLVTDSGENNPQEMMGMDAHHEWVLHGPFLDKTLIRNYMCYNLAGQIMSYAPNVRFCEVLINGEYNGLYLMVESITAGNAGARLDIKVDRKDNSYSGYVIRLDRGSETPIKNIVPFSLYSMRKSTGGFNIIYPGTANLNEQLVESITQDFSNFEHMLYTYDFDHSEYGYSKTIDVDSFVNYFLINEFTSNYDAGNYSTYIYKGTNGKYRMCVWDFNNAFDSYQEQAIDHETFLLHESLWFNMIIKDKDFTERVIKRYHELRKTYFSDDYLNNYIDETIAYLGDAIDRNFEKWGYTFESDHNLLYPTTRNLRSYDEAVAQLKGYIASRGAWMDENIDVLRQYSANSKTKLAKEHTR